MTSEMTIFNNEDFGQIRTVTIEGKVYFIGSDVAKSLGYKRPNDAISAHCKGTVNHSIGVVTGKRADGSDAIQYIDMNVISEGDLYRLIFSSKLPKAEGFESWVVDEVLPMIRMEGAYVTERANPNDLRSKADDIERLNAVNKAVEQILPVLDSVGLKGNYKALSLKQLYSFAGIELPIQSLESEIELYDLTMIAKELNILSESGKPHNQAVGTIISKLDVEDSEIQTVSFEKNGHMGATKQYTKSVVDKVESFIVLNNYPTRIEGKDKGFNIKYSK